MDLNEDVTQTWTEPLSARELEVLQLLSDGLSNREIANNLFLAIDTVKWYNKQMYLKLGVSNRTQAAKKAADLKMLESEQIPSTQEKERVVGNLPAQVSSYIGREREIREIKELLRENRLVTLTGAGGSGKTRLALQVAEELQGSYPDGIWLVELANLHETSLVLQTIASVLGISEKTETDLIEEVKQNLKDKHLLLLIDNFEHLLDSAPLISELLSTAPQLSVLGTSRERLHVYGEQEYPVSPLNLPDPNSKWMGDKLKKIEAIALFIERARAVKPGLSLDEETLQHMARICMRLDGLPLAIELCAPMVKIFPLSMITERIENNLDSIPYGPRDLPARQQTLNKTLQWSIDLLSEDEKRLFERLSIFSGGGTLEAIQSICTNGISGNISSLLSGLVHKNLVLPRERVDGKIHFILLETIRQFNQDRLKNQGQLESLSKLHAEYFTRLAQKAEPHLSGADQVRWLEMLEVEHDNMRSALEWCQTAKGAAELGLNLAGSLESFWGTRGYFSEGRRYLALVLSRPGASMRTVARAKALHAAGLLAYLQSSYPETRLLLEEGLSIYRELDISDHQALANALITLGDMETELGNYDIAFEFMNEALEIMRELNNIRGIARALWQLGGCAVRPGKYDQAIHYFDEALIYLRKIGDRGQTSIALSGLAEVAIRQGDFERAAILEEESISMRREIKDPWGIAVSLGNFAWISLRQGDLDQALNLLRESLTLRRDIGDKGGGAWCLEKLAEIALLIGQKKSNQNYREYYHRAAKLFGAAEAMREPVESMIDLVDQPEYNRHVEVIHKQLGEPTFMKAWAEGREMSMEKAIEYALDYTSTS